jgi:hypothetical protein
MNTSDAAKILELDGSITPELVKAAYRRMAMKYHPDRNPAGLEMMQAVNEALAVLKEYTGEVAQGAAGYGEALNDAINAVVTMAGIKIEICGAWVWLSGDTYPHRVAIKAAGFMWASKKKMWYFRPDDWKGGRGRDMDEIRAKYGSQEVAPKQAPSIK